MFLFNDKKKEKKKTILELHLQCDITSTLSMNI